MRGVDRFFDGRDDFALNGHGPARDARASRGGVTAAAKLRRDFIHVHFLAFGAEADAGQFGLQFFENAGDNDWRNCPNVIDESF